MALQQNQVQDIIATALIKASEDAVFREKLLAEPIYTIEKLTGERLNFDAPAANFETTLGSYDDFNDEELSVEELDFVTGGAQIGYNSKEEFVSFLQSYL